MTSDDTDETMNSKSGAPHCDKPANDEPGPRFTGARDRKKELSATLARLKQEHRDLDAAIESLESSMHSDQLQLKRLKKKKLVLKDEIAKTEDDLFPDIIA